MAGLLILLLLMVMPTSAQDENDEGTPLTVLSCEILEGCKTVLTDLDVEEGEIILGDAPEDTDTIVCVGGFGCSWLKPELTPEQVDEALGGDGSIEEIIINDEGEPFYDLDELEETPVIDLDELPENDPVIIDLFCMDDATDCDWEDIDRRRMYDLFLPADYIQPLSGIWEFTNEVPELSGGCPVGIDTQAAGLIQNHTGEIIFSEPFTLQDFALGFNNDPNVEYSQPGTNLYVATITVPDVFHNKIGFFVLEEDLIWGYIRLDITGMGSPCRVFISYIIERIDD